MVRRGPRLGMMVAIAALAGAGPSSAQVPGTSEFGADRLPAAVTPPAPPAGATLGRPAVPPTYTLDDFVRLGLERHPRLAQAGFAVEAARGRAVQAGLYPNPTVSATFD